MQQTTTARVLALSTHLPMEFNAARDEADAGSDIQAFASKDLRICPEQIGSGSLNDVYRGQLIPAQQTCSCKINTYTVKKLVRDSSVLPALFAVKQIKAATAVLQSNKAPGDWFVKLVGVSADERYFYLVQESMIGGDLRKYMNELWSEDDAKFLGRQLFTRMKFMHENNLMHLDLKPGVIYPSFKDDGTIQFKISDLGVSKRIAFDKTWPLELKKIISDRPRERAYMAPEFYEFNGDTGVFTDRADSWSVGCILYRVITGADIFPNLLTMVKYFNSGQPSPREGLMAQGLSETGILFIESLLHKNPHRRLSAIDALKHLWLETEEAHRPSESLAEKLHMAIAKNTQNLTCVTPECDMHRDSCPLIPDNLCILHPTPVPVKPVGPGPQPPRNYMSWLWKFASGWRSFF
ncbi:kinase-like domain-containing protein [Tirmania nivea]|nr:kinase-like domain-containing protein [Tirmania nivea]